MELEKKTHNPDLWKNSDEAKKLLSKLENLRKEIDLWESFKKEAEDLLETQKLIEDYASDGLYKSYENEAEEFKKRVLKLEENFQKQKLIAKMQGKYDNRNAILAIHAGAGGADAQDWAEMLMRMYLRFCEKRGWDAKIADKSEGSEAGIKSVQIEISGGYAYGHLKSEKGTHRLVRLSPFNANHLRQTSFALVEVFPEIESEEAEIKSADLEISVFRSSGPGGQSVNTTDSAVRIKHKPTGITVSCQNERSQMQNKELALKILRSKLADLQEQKEEDERKKEKGKHVSAEWGSQIRSYVLHPYKLIKDHRTGVEASNVEGVLDGEIDTFIG